MTPTQITSDVYRGIRLINDRHPCSVCNQGTTFEELPHFHGSDFGLCARSVQHAKMVGGNNTFDDQTRAFLQDGHEAEALIVRALRASGHSVMHRRDTGDGDEFRVWINPEAREITKVPSDLVRCLPDDARPEGSLLVIGHTDGVIDRDYLLECKAVKDWAFENKFRAGQLPAKYLGQMKCYMTCLDLKGGYLVVKARPTSEYLTFFVPRDDDYIYKRAALLRDIVGQLQTRQWLDCAPLEKAEQRFCQACKILGRK